MVDDGQQDQWVYDAAKSALFPVLHATVTDDLGGMEG